ncbi:DNA polymerase [Paenibacillus hexagrammi]|uniref:DNA-directed DNA polymerase n=1 Tax=Paenibacillus hexagrammi TaxID=2908839 RepID=A0ABY3SUD1_9BACL|nr:DNA polymerase A family protein [Paenibacillus sp. YPD9-1]UJF36586.1 DNA polymerase [Paenibacillus sp. YPD9-1]
MTRTLSCREIYAAGDGHKTFKLYKFQKPYIDTLDNLRTVWYRIEQHLLHVDLMMEREGFNIDLDHLNGLREKFGPILAKAEADLREAFGINAHFIAKMNADMERDDEDFNLQSPHHLGYLIYDVLGIDSNFGKKFNKPYRSTAAEVVDAICEDFEQLKPLLKFRKLNKLVTTYVDKIPNALEPTTGKIHCRFNNLGSEEDKKGGAATGRYSSSEYVSKKHSKTGAARGTNLQNIPSKGEGVEVRRSFVPDDDWIFLGADLSQIEPRIIATILADVYGDPSMQNFYREGKDLYVKMAMLTFGFDRDHCVDGAYDPSGEFQPRKLMKQGVLSYLYGSSAKAFARNMGVSEDIAAMFFEKMIVAFPGLADFRADVIQKLMTVGNNAYSETLYGRKRRFPNYRKNKKEFDAIEEKCLKDGLKIYVQINADGEFALKGRDDEEQEEIDARRARVKAKKYTEADKEAITKIGLYWRNKDKKNRYWEVRGWVKSDERAALNHIVQGTAADIIKMNLVEMYRFTFANNFKTHCSIHDEIIISVPKANLTPELVEQVERIMTSTATISTPLKTDIVIMERWMDEVKPKDWDFDLGSPIETKEVA